jgi:hypothetical protein
MTKLRYTVSFLHVDGSRHVSRFFSTKAAARKWQKWLRAQSYVAQTFLHYSQGGVAV